MSKPYYNEKVPSGAIGMVILLFTELMFFVGLISGFLVNRIGAVSWPPVGQPRLPIEATAVNTLFLLASAVTIYLFFKKYSNNKKSKSLLYATIFLGVLFLSIQGYEWVQLLGYGLTTSSSLYGAYFYGIIGVHGFHVIIGVILLFYMMSKFNKNAYADIKGVVLSCTMYWYFVVAIWPFLYFLVYLM